MITVKPLVTPGGALIMYDQRITSVDVTAAEAALVPNTYSRWIRDTTNNIFSFGSDTLCDFICISGHTMGTLGVPITVQVAETPGGPYTNVYESNSPPDDSPIVITFDPVVLAEIRIQLPSSTESTISYVNAGTALKVEREIYGGHRPINLQPKTEYQNSVSDSGNFLGRTIKRKGFESRYRITNLDPVWYRRYFFPFVEACRTRPFVIQWRPDLFSNETAFGYYEGDIGATNSGTGLMETSFRVRAYNEL